MKFTLEIPDSNNLAKAEYNDETKLLSLTFKNNLTYSYTDVPKEIFDGLSESKSKGQYFHKSIKNAFKFVKQEKKEEDISVKE